MSKNRYTKSALGALLVILTLNSIGLAEPVKSASELDFPPFAIVHEDGSAGGFSVELMRAALHAMGRDVTFDIGPWSQIRQDLEAGRLEALPLVGRTPEREHVLDFTVPYLTLFGAVFVREDDDRIESIKDLRGLRVGVLKGGNAGEYLQRENLSDQLVPTTALEDAFLMLSRGELDAVLAQRLVGLGLIEKMGLTNIKKAIAPVAGFRQDFCFAVTEGNKAMLAQLNEGLAIVVADGTYDHLHRKWLGILHREDNERILFLETMSWSAGLLVLFLLCLFFFQHWRGHRRLKHSEERLRRVMQNMPVIFDAIDSKGNFIVWNQEAERTTGYSAEEIVGNPHARELLYPDYTYRERLLKEWQTRGDHRGWEWMVTAKDGTELAIEWSNISTQHPIPGWASWGIGVDVTDRKRARELLLQSEQRYRAVFDQAAVGIARIAPNGSWLEVNKKLCDIVGYSRDALQGMTFQEITHPEDLDANLGFMQQILDGAASQCMMEKRYIRSNGESIWINLTSSLVRNQDGTPQYFVSIIEDIQSRKQAEEELHQYERIVSSTSDMLALLDKDYIYLATNTAYLNAFGKERGEILGHSASEILGDAFFSSVYKPNTERCLQGKHITLQDWFDYPAIGRRYMVVNYSPYYTSDGDIMGLVVTAHDLTELKLAEDGLRLAADVFTHTLEGISITDAEGTIVDVNDAFTRITGYSREEAIGQNPRILKSGHQDDEFYLAMWHDLIEKGHWYGDIWNRRKDGEVYAEYLSISAVRDANNKTQNYIGFFSDITVQKRHQKQLEHVAHYDALTDLPNRVLLADRLQQGIVQAQRRTQKVAVAYLDLDGFKKINDEHGHESGDQLLITLAKRLKNVLREGDTIARVGGDEFVILLIDLPEAKDSVPLLERLLSVAAQPVDVNNFLLQVSASLGVTFYPQIEEIGTDQLLRQADQAMYQAKLAGKNRFHVFDAEQDRNVRGYHEDIGRIQQGLAKHEYVLHYQPKVDMRSGEILGAEALIRWQHPERGLLYPGNFLPGIEGHPLSAELDEWVIDSALTQIERWREDGLDLPVSVNVSAHLLQEVDFVERLKRLLALHPKVDASHLILEVLETSALEDITLVSAIMRNCIDLGVRFALDDFGTGYSSLTYLKRLPAAQIKIDQSFVRDMLDDPEDLAIVEGVLGLATSFRRNALAEGVETLEHGNLLLQLGCTQAQGYAIAKPMPANELTDWARTWHPPPTWKDRKPISRDEIPLLFGGVEHRAWIQAVEDYLLDKTTAPPMLDHNECQLGLWLNGEGKHRYGNRGTFQAIESVHLKVHQLSSEMLALKAEGRCDEALAEISELHVLRDDLVLRLNDLRAH